MQTNYFSPADKLSPLFLIDSYKFYLKNYEIFN